MIVNFHLGVSTAGGSRFSVVCGDLIFAVIFYFSPWHNITAA